MHISPATAETFLTGMSFEVFMVVSVYIMVLWDVTPCSPVGVYQVSGKHMPPSSQSHEILDLCEAEKACNVWQSS
jgi:hypothetical protein